VHTALKKLFYGRIPTMQVANEKLLKEIDEKAEALKRKILNAKDEIRITGQAYYVSNNGNDENDGKSPETPWASLTKVNSFALQSGDGVFFERGGLWRGQLFAKEGVTYAAYGEGNKPKFYSWKENLADPSLWELYDKEHNIWKYTDTILDAGTLVFNEGERHSRKLIPSYNKYGKFVCRDNEQKEFVMAEEMTQNLDIFCNFAKNLTTVPSKGENFPIPDMYSKYDPSGELFLRCDEGNPGEVFDSIEANERIALIRVSEHNNVRIDNLCLKYCGVHAVSAAGIRNTGLRVTNCEIGWIGGSIQTYAGTDPNYPEGTRGSVTRFGNGVEIYGGCDNYTVSNCYIYQIYDAGITHQMTASRGVDYLMTNIEYSENLVEYAVYSIEYFLEIRDESNSYMKGIKMHDNILRYSGYGWGQQRHNYHTPAQIKGWSYENPASDYEIYNNIFDRAAYRMLHLVAKKPESLPKMYGNTYIQYENNMIGQYGANEEKEPDILCFDENAEKTVKETLGDKDASVIVIKN